MQPVLRYVKNLGCPGWVLSVMLLGSCGCANFLDTITARDFKVNDLWSKPPDPLIVLRDSTDGAKRGQALASMKEPRAHGGTEEKQEQYVQILVEKATKNPPLKNAANPLNPYPDDTDPDCLNPLVRLGAIRALADYKDPRAAKALENVYYGIDPGTLPAGVRQGPLPFHPQINNNIRMQALAALEKTGSATAREVFIRVAVQPQPGSKYASMDQNLTNDERLAALRGLARFHDQEVLNTLLGVLEAEKNIALRQRAHQSLVVITGKHIPQQDVARWRDLVQNSSPDAYAHQPGTFQRFLNMIGN